MFELGLLVGELGHAEMAEPAVVRLKVGQRGEERPENVESNKTGLKPVSKTAHIVLLKPSKNEQNVFWYSNMFFYKMAAN